jgi:hypothetical protein
MTGQAIFLMVFTNIIFIVVTAYLFIKVVKTPPRPEPDSFQNNDGKVDLYQ